MSVRTICARVSGSIKLWTQIVGRVFAEFEDNLGGSIGIYKICVTHTTAIAAAIKCYNFVFNFVLKKMFFFPYFSLKQLAKN